MPFKSQATSRASICALFVTILALLNWHQDAGAATTAWQKLHYYKIGNDAFKVYDFTKGMPGHEQHLQTLANNVDWPVTMIFKGNASINRVKAGFASTKLKDEGTHCGHKNCIIERMDNSGTSMYAIVIDHVPNMGLSTTSSRFPLWDDDKGVKEIKCSSHEWSPTNHIRLYADSRGITAATSDDRLYNPYFGYYVIGTTHRDYKECTLLSKSFGHSELAEIIIGYRAGKVWGFGRLEYNKYFIGNPEPYRVQNDHKWENNGYVTMMNIP